MKTPVSVLVALIFLGAVRAADPGDSVVKVNATLRGPDLFRPWNKQMPYESNGSGVVIEGKQILTNAHVVLYATEIFVQGKDGGDKVEARIKSIQPGIDLAVLTVEKDDFFTNRPPLTRAKKMPQERDPVEVYGFPLGGMNQSVTKGIVSRLDYAAYSTQTQGLRIQIDAALNPGNSGGPALSGNEMIGLAFSRFPVGLGANIGYIIPNEEIEAFLRDPRDKPKLLGQFQPLENETLRKKLGLNEKTQGVLVCNSSGPLHKLDILTHLGTHELDNLGQVKVGEKQRYQFQYVIPSLAKDGKVPATVVRDGKPMKLDLPVSNGDDFILREMRGQYPSYFLYGPLVFTTATMNSAAQVSRAPGFDLTGPLVRRQNDQLRFPEEELVLISSPMFRHKCVRGYTDPAGGVVQDINGVKVKNLRHMVEVLRDCKDDYITFGFAGERTEVFILDRREMSGVTRQVMEENSIPRQASSELMEVWNRKVGRK